MLDFVIISLLLALAVAWALNVFTISGLREKCILKAPDLLAQMLSCDFCLSFWSSFVASIILAIVMQRVEFIVIAIFVAPIVKKLI